MSYNNCPVDRKRRSLLDFVGSLQHVLCGVMENSDRKIINSNFKALIENQNDISSLVKKQTSVIDSTLNFLKKTGEEVNTQFKGMKDQLDAFYKEVIANQNKEKVALMALIYHMLMLEISMVLGDFEQIQNKLMNLLID
jgi:hypothetical protein